MGAGVPPHHRGTAHRRGLQALRQRRPGHPARLRSHHHPAALQRTRPQAVHHLVERRPHAAGRPQQAPAQRRGQAHGHPRRSHLPGAGHGVRADHVCQQGAVPRGRLRATVRIHLRRLRHPRGAGRAAAQARQRGLQHFLRRSRLHARGHRPPGQPLHRLQRLGAKARRIPQGAAQLPGWPGRRLAGLQHERSAPARRLQHLRPARRLPGPGPRRARAAAGRPEPAGAHGAKVHRQAMHARGAAQPAMGPVGAEHPGPLGRLRRLGQRGHLRLYPQEVPAGLPRPAGHARQAGPGQGLLRREPQEVPGDVRRQAVHRRAQGLGQDPAARRRVQVLGGHQAHLRLGALQRRLRRGRQQTERHHGPGPRPRLRAGHVHPGPAIQLRPERHPGRPPARLQPLRQADPRRPGHERLRLLGG